MQYFIKNGTRKREVNTGHTVNTVPYRPVWPVYTVPVSAPIQIHPLFHTGKNTGRTGEIQLFRLVNGYRPEQKAIDLNAHSDPKTLSINVLVCETRERGLEAA